jgi:hypothetical protein
MSLKFEADTKAKDTDDVQTHHKNPYLKPTVARLFTNLQMIIED